MSESAVKAYEEKAKTGLLFGDRDLSNLYDGLRNALSSLGVTGNDASKLGITSSYTDGLTTISLDESALRAALTENPDKVKDLFTKSTSTGDSSDGLMQSLKTVNVSVKKLSALDLESFT
jgi:flagellar hook-associated protein 2